MSKFCHFICFFTVLFPIILISIINETIATDLKIKKIYTPRINYQDDDIPVEVEIENANVLPANKYNLFFSISNLQNTIIKRDTLAGDTIKPFTKMTYNYDLKADFSPGLYKLGVYIDFSEDIDYSNNSSSDDFTLLLNRDSVKKIMWNYIGANIKFPLTNFVNAWLPYHAFDTNVAVSSFNESELTLPTAVKTYRFWNIELDTTVDDLNLELEFRYRSYLDDRDSTKGFLGLVTRDSATKPFTPYLPIIIDWGRSTIRATGVSHLSDWAFARLKDDPMSVEDNNPRNPVINIYPNPVADFATIGFRLARTSDVSIEIMDPAGRKLAQIINKHLNDGNYDILYDVSNFCSGIYLLKTSINGINTFEKIIINK